VLNVLFILTSGLFWGWKRLTAHGGMSHGSGTLTNTLLFGASMIAFGWLLIGLMLPV
jgi:hypothetical protein